jgi:hypothetical protein
LSSSSTAKGKQRAADTGGTFQDIPLAEVGEGRGARRYRNDSAAATGYEDDERGTPRDSKDLEEWERMEQRVGVEDPWSRRDADGTG